MEDDSASKNPKRANAKKDKEDMTPKTSFFSKMKKITDTNIATVDMIRMRDRLKEGQSPLAKRIYKSGIVHAAAFPPTLPCPELIMECASRFDLDSKSIIFGEGKRVLANIGEQAIEETFNIPQSKGMTVVMVDQAAKSFQGNQEAYFSHLKRNWICKGI